MNTNQHPSVESVSENEVLGSLPFSDQLYNALHGSGDISCVAKVAVVTVMHDYYHPGRKIVTEELLGRYPGHPIGRDHIIHTFRQCLASAPKPANEALCRWVEELKAVMEQNVTDALREADE